MEDEDGESEAAKKDAKREAARRKKRAASKTDDELMDDVDSALAEGKDSAAEAAAKKLGATSLTPITAKALKPVRPTEETPVRLKDLIAIQLRRGALERIVDEPYFLDFVKTKFVRISIGDKEGVPVYRVCEVVGQFAAAGFACGSLLFVWTQHQTDVQQFKVKYKFGHHKDFQKGLLLAHGKNQRIFAMNLVSNHSITQVCC